jgi:hypothetical protein
MLEAPGDDGNVYGITVHHSPHLLEDFNGAEQVRENMLRMAKQSFSDRYPNISEPSTVLSWRVEEVWVDEEES